LRRDHAQPHDDDRTLAERLLTALEGADDEHHADLVRALCELATDADPIVRRRGQQLLFSNTAEVLGDSFDSRAVTTHDRLFSSVIEFCRHQPDASHLDGRLDRLFVRDRADLLRRRSTLAAALPISDQVRERVRKIFVLSRITLGADVAVISPLLQVLQRACPNADRYLVGPSNVGQLLAGLAGARMLEQSYDRGDLLPRLDSWYRLSEMLEGETTGLADTEWLVIDPDSRMTQLGLLPVARPTVPYLFFESRAYRVAGLETLGELARHWLTHALGCDDAEDIHPRIELSRSLVAQASSIVQVLRERKPFVVAVNLGVGGNPRKRIAGDFELKAVRAFLAEGSAVVLDHGAGEDEARVRAIVAALRAEGRSVHDLKGSELSSGSVPAGCDVLAFQGPVAPFAALTGASDLYVGYDSGFQHIAAAQRIPVVDIFVNPPNAVFPRRWRPHSSASVIVIETASDGDHGVNLARIAEAHRRGRQALGTG
jgi:ADP-heptose:LPS heptosyltransferase